MYLNRITVIGRLVADPELKKGDAADSSNDRVWGRVAVNRPGSDTADFVPFVCWGATARATAEHCKKGKEVTLDGQLRTRSTQREEGGWDNYFEINCGSVSFGADAKNNKTETAPAPASVAPAAAPALDAATAGAVALLLKQLQGTTPAASASPTESPFPHIPL